MPYKLKSNFRKDSFIFILKNKGELIFDMYVEFWIHIYEISGLNGYVYVLNKGYSFAFIGFSLLRTLIFFVFFKMEMFEI